MSDAFKVVKDFERAVGEYTGAPYVVAVNSCTMALLLAVAWSIRYESASMGVALGNRRPGVEIPRRTYVSVPMSIIHAGARPIFRDEHWVGKYALAPYPIWDSARRFTSGMFDEKPHHERPIAKRAALLDRRMQCVSFHWSKILGIQQGGAILHNNPEADDWLRRARFDGRTEGVAPKDDNITSLGWHCYMSPEIAAAGLVRLHHLPLHNADLPNDDYPDLSQMEIFK